MDEATIIRNLKAFTFLSDKGFGDAGASIQYSGVGIGSAEAQTQLHACADALIDAVLRDFPKRRKKRILETHLVRINKNSLNRRDQTRVARCFRRLSTLADVNVSFVINQWQHGWAVALVGMLLGSRGF